jgi:hypothetical protein
MKTSLFLFLSLFAFSARALAQSPGEAESSPGPAVAEPPVEESESASRGEGPRRNPRHGDAAWDCDPEDITTAEAGESERRIEKWFCRPRKSVRLLLGLQHRGVLSETGSFSDKLGFEAGVRLFSRLDLALGVGQVFKEGSEISLDAHGRLFLLDLPGTGGPYVGGGWRFRDTSRGFATFGFFGGSGLFFEIQFRGSPRQPVAVVPALGLRAAFL